MEYVIGFRFQERGLNISTKVCQVSSLNGYYKDNYKGYYIVLLLFGFRML